MGITSTLGRVFIAAIFVLAAIDKYNTFGSDGGPLAGYTLQKFAKFVEKLPFDLPFPLPEGKQLVMAGGILEGLGGALLLLDVYLGAYLLMLFLSVATIVFHDFYNEAPNSMAFQTEFIQFFKNLAILGGLLIYLDAASKSAARKAAAASKAKKA